MVKSWKSWKNLGANCFGADIFKGTSLLCCFNGKHFLKLYFLSLKLYENTMLTQWNIDLEMIKCFYLVPGYQTFKHHCFLPLCYTWDASAIQTRYEKKNMMVAVSNKPKFMHFLWVHLRAVSLELYRLTLVCLSPPLSCLKRGVVTVWLVKWGMHPAALSYGITNNLVAIINRGVHHRGGCANEKASPWQLSGLK